MTISNTLTLRLISAGFSMTISTPHRFDWLHQVFPWLCQAHLSSATDFSRFFHEYVKHTPSSQLSSAGLPMTISNTLHRFDWLQQVFPLPYQTRPSLRRTPAGFSMTISNTPIDLTDLSRFFHDYIKHTHRLDWLQQVFPWLYQTNTSPWLTRVSFSMTMSCTHLFNWLQQVFPWLCQAHTSSTDFGRFFHDYIKHNSSLRLTSAGFSMTISNKPIASTDFTWFFHDYIKHTHRLDWLQQVFTWLCQAHTPSTDFSRFLHDYVKHTPLQLTSAGFSMTISSTHLFNWLQQVFPSLYQTHSPLRLTSAGFFMTISNTPIASTDFSRFFHDYIKHTYRFDWLQQVFPWIYQTHPSSRLTSAGFSITISNTLTASTDFSRFFYDYIQHPIVSTDFSGFVHDYIKHTYRFDWLQQVFPWIYQTHPSSRLTSAGFSMTISNTSIASIDFSRFFHDYVKHTPLQLTSAGFFMTISNTLTASTDFSRFFHDYVKHTPLRRTSAGFYMTMSSTHLFNWLSEGFQQVFPWLYQTHPSPRLTSAGFSMTISNITIASTDFSWFSHDYVKNTPLQLTSAGFSMTMSSIHLFNWLQQVFPWLCQAHTLQLTSASFSITISNILTASTDFSRVFHDYIKHTHLLDWLQQVFPWLCQTHPSPWLTSAGFSMTIKHTHRLDWLQKVVPCLCQAHTSSTDFSRFLHDYVKHTPLQLTSAGFSIIISNTLTASTDFSRFIMTISNTPIALTDFSRFFHDYIKHTHRLDWLQQVFPWLCQAHTSSTDFSLFLHDYVKHTPLQLTSAGFSRTVSNTLTASTDFSRFFMTISKTPIDSTDFSKLFHDYIKHTHRLDWLQQVFPWLYQTHSRFDWFQQVFLWLYPHPIASTDFSGFFHDYIKHTYPFDWLQQVFPWIYQTHPSSRLTSAGFSMTISNTSIASTDFSKFFHDHSKHAHRFDGLQQVFPWLYQTHPSTWLTSAGFSMTISNKPIASTDFTRFFHDYIKHTHRLDWLQQVFPWLCHAHTSSTDFSRFFHDYVKHTPLQLTSAGFFMTISNTLIASTDFSRFFNDYIKQTHRFDWLHLVFPWLYQTYTSPRLTSAGFYMTMSSTHPFNWLQQVFTWLCQAHTSSTDFSRFFHDYFKHTPLQLTSAGFSITISNTLSASTDFTRFFHDYIKHTHRLDWLQQVFPWLYQTHLSLRLTSAGFSMNISNTPIVSSDFSRFFHHYIKHTHRFDWFQQVFLWLYPTPHRFDWLQRVCPWLYQTHLSLRLTSAGFSMNISNTPIISSDFSRFFHDYIKHIHCFDWLQQVFPWLCQAHTSSTDFSRFFHDYIKHTHRFDWLQQVFSWLCQAHTSSTDVSRFLHDNVKHTPLQLTFRRFSHNYQTHPSPRLTSAGFSMTISNTPIASTDFSRFFHDYIKHNHRLDWLQLVFPWLCQEHTSSTDFSRFFHDYVKHTPLQLTTAGFSMTMSSTYSSTDFSKFFHHYI